MDEQIEPLRFPTVNHAQTAIDEFFADVKHALAAGDMDIGEDRDDYRIVAAND